MFSCFSPQATTEGIKSILKMKGKKKKSMQTVASPAHRCIQEKTEAA